MEEEIYITSDGLEFKESVLREEYGDKFDTYVSQGFLKKKEVAELASVSEDGSSEQAGFEPSDLEVLEKDFGFPETNEDPQQTNVVDEIPEVLSEEEVEVTVDSSQIFEVTNEQAIESLLQKGISSPSKEQIIEELNAINQSKLKDPNVLKTEKQRSFLESKGVDVDAMLKTRKFGNSATTNTEAGDIDLEYNTFINNNASQNIQTDFTSTTLKPVIEEVEEGLEIKPTKVSRAILDELKIDVEDFSKWEANTQREESLSFRLFKKAASEEGQAFKQEKKDTEKILSYKMKVMESLRKDIDTIDSRLQIATNPKDQLQLLNIKKELEAKLTEESNLLSKMGSLFPTYKEFTYDLDLQRRKRIYEASQEGGAVRLFTELGETAKTIPVTISNFALGSGAAITSLLDQALTGVGADKKGALAGITEMLLDAGEAIDIEIGPVKRSGVTQGKNVTIEGIQYVVTEEGDVLDPVSNVSLVGIISDEKFNQIKKRADNVKFSERNYSGGALVQGGIQTLANLFALIKGGQALSKSLGVSGGTGMGLASYASTSAQSVEDMRSDLVSAGLTEDEALNKAAVAGNAIATLDGVFSGLAGSNTKVLSSLTGFKTAIINAVKKDGKKFTLNELKRKVAALGEENMKELLIEELPVLFSEKAISAAVNELTGLSVRSSSVKRSEIMETVIMTLGATTTLGSINLLSRNRRLDALRYVARNVSDLDKTVTELVRNNNITEDQGKKVYQEIYAMQTAENRTKGTIVDSENMLEVSDLLDQRQRLIDQKKGLEGPLVEEIDQKIADVDEQITQAKERDNQQTKTEQDADTIKSSDEVLNEEQPEVGKAVVEGDNQPTELTGETTQTQKENPVEPTQEDQVKVEDIQDTEIVIEEGKPLTVNENKQVFRAVRDPKTPKETRRKAFLDIINKIKTKGKVAARTVKSLIKEVEKLNFANPVTVEKTIQRITKTFEKANNVDALNKANETKKKIKKRAGKEGLDANVSAAAKEFLRIDPLTVDDLTKYQQEATKLLKGLPSTRRTKTGIKVAPAVNIKSIEEYSAKEIVAQEKREAQIQADAFEALTGVPPGDLSLSEVRETIEALDTTDENKKKEAAPSEKKSKVIFDALKNAFSVYTAVVDEQLKTQTDPFTGEKIEITNKDKQLVRAFMNMDLNVLTDQEALQALDSLINFATNASTGGMGKVVNLYVGKTNLVKAIKDGLKGKSLTSVGRKWAKNIASFDLMIEFIFKGQSKANKILALSGFQDVVNGAAKAETDSNKIAANYSDKFSKTKPNGQAFNTAENNTERGMLAFVRRTLIGTEAEQQQEFNRKKALILETIKTLSNTSDKVNKTKAETYQKVYDRLLSDSNNITDVESKVDKENLAAVEWMTEEWKKHYKDLSDTNLNIYNKTLDQDINYTPDIFSALKTPETENIDEPMFDTSGRKIYNKETGVLKKSNRPKSLGNERYVNLSFDTSNINSLRKALADINTAAAIQQVKGFVESKDFDKVIPNKQDRDLVKQRIKEYVSKKRGLDYIPEDDKKLMRLINTFGTFGVSRTLGSLGQFPKQLTPIFNTMINAGGANTYNGLGLFRKKTVREWLKDSGYDIANRGLQSETALESIDKQLDEAANSVGEKARRIILDAQNKTLKLFLVAPDKFAANSSWLAYYSKEMKKQGIDVTAPGFDWENHKVNKKAGDYAQQQVNRQQNTSDRDLQGEMYRSNKISTQLFVKGFFPFANFLLNQKTRMYSDVSTVFSKTATSEDKKAAAKSLGGLLVETLAFNALGLGLTQLTASLSNAWMGEDDEEQAEKDFNNRMKGRGQNVVLDLFSPLPITDEIFISRINNILEFFQDEEDPFQFFENQKTMSEDLGLFSIGFEKFKEMVDFSSVSASGEYKKENAFGASKTHKLSDEEKQAAMSSTALYIAYLTGYLPAEAGSIARYNMRTIKRNASKAVKYLNADQQARLKKSNPRRWEKEYGPKSFYQKDKERKSRRRKARR